MVISLRGLLIQIFSIPCLLVALGAPAFASAADCFSKQIGKAISQGSSQSFWTGLSSQFQQNSTRFIRDHHAYYLQLKSQGHPQIEFLESLGYRFHPEIRVPDLDSIFQSMNQQIEAHIQSGRLAREDAIFPVATVVDDATGNYRFFQYGEDVFAKTQISPRAISSTEESVIPDDLFFEVVAGGRFPVGSPHVTDKVKGLKNTGVEHDLGHLGALVENPELMSSYSRSIRERVASGVKGGRGNDERLRLFVAMESWVETRPVSEARLTEYLGLDAATVGSNPSVDDLIENLSTRSVRELEELSNSFHEKVWDVINPIGGAERDLTSHTAFMDGYRFQLPLRIFLDEVPTGAVSHLSSQELRKSVIRPMAVYQKFILELSQTPTDQVVRELISQSERPHLHRIFCHSQILRYSLADGASDLMFAFCQ